MTDETLRWQTDRLLGLETAREGISVFVRSLRFARLRRYREDKGPGDAGTIDTVRALLP